MRFVNTHLFGEGRYGHQGRPVQRLAALPLLGMKQLFRVVRAAALIHWINDLLDEPPDPQSRSLDAAQRDVRGRMPVSRAFDNWPDLQHTINPSVAESRESRDHALWPILVQRGPWNAFRCVVARCRGRFLGGIWATRKPALEIPLHSIQATGLEDSAPPAVRRRATNSS